MYDCTWKYACVYYLENDGEAPPMFNIDRPLAGKGAIIIQVSIKIPPCVPFQAIKIIAWHAACIISLEGFSWIFSWKILPLRDFTWLPPGDDFTSLEREIRTVHGI